MYRYYLQNTDMYVAPATLTRIVNIYIIIQYYYIIYSCFILNVQ